MIVGKRVRLRAIELDDLPLLVTWRNDPRIYECFFEHEPLSLVMQQRWFERFLQRGNEKFWIAEIIESSEPIGTVALVDIDWRNRKAELGRVMIYPLKLQGQCYGSEMLSLTLRYAFEHLQLNRLYCEVFADNETALLLYRTFGFEQEGRFRQHVFKAGRYRDVLSLALLQENYFAVAQKAVQNHLGNPEVT